MQIDTMQWDRLDALRKISTWKNNKNERREDERKFLEFATTSIASVKTYATNRSI